MNKGSYNILRVGIGITFLWVAVLIFKSPENWGALLQPWAAGLLPIPIKEAMIGTAILDALTGFLLLIDLWVWPAVVFGIVHLLTVIITVGITEITVRDLGLLTALISLFFESFPRKIIKTS